MKLTHYRKHSTYQLINSGERIQNTPVGMSYHYKHLSQPLEIILWQTLTQFEQTCTLSAPQFMQVCQIKFKASRVSSPPSFQINQS